jgi:beta-galactosidase
MNHQHNRRYFPDFNLNKMNKLKLINLIPILFMQISIVLSQPRTVIELCDNWKFQKGQNNKAFQQNFDDQSWQAISIPHDWAIYGPFDKEIDKQNVIVEQNLQTRPFVLTGRTGSLPFIGEGWYRKHFKLPANYMKGQKVIITFDGAMSQPEVFLNGEKIGQWNNGYNYFYIDITDKIILGQENVLAVKCSNLEQSSRWYPGAGLYRKVRLVIKNPESVDQWGTFITTPFVSKELAKINVKTKASGKDLRLVTQIIDSSGKIVASDTTQTIYSNEFEQNIPVVNPKLWSPETPNLYFALTKVFKGKVQTDEFRTRFGIREINYSSKYGFRLNGEVRKFKGVCLHHDLGPIGTAINVAALRRQLLILKDLGCNAIRTSHNMPSQEQMDLCDEMGFMVMAEAFDEWVMPKVKNGYHRFFESDAEKDVINLVQVNRNHPSIVMWSAGNEVPDQRNAEGVKRAKWLMDVFHREDPTHPVTVGMNEVEASMKTGFGALLDIPGLNYHTNLYEEAYRTFPQGFILGSETAGTVSSRGVYKFPVEQTVYKTFQDGQCSSYDLGYCFWSNLPDNDFEQQDKPWVIGEFVWTGFDYLGEPSPYDTVWPSHSSYFGMVDLAGLPKDRYYLYRSRWNTEESTLHILPHWTWPGREGETTPVFVYTNYDSAELFVNGKSQGVQYKNNSTLQNRNRLMWMNVKYEPGTLKVVALNKEGNPVKETQIVTAGKPYKIVLEPDRTHITADGNDLSFVTVSVVDKKGNPCPTASQQLNFKVTGKGTYRAACNGDATSLEMFHLPTMKLFSGKLVVLVQSTTELGTIGLSVKGQGLKEGNIVLESVR